MEQIQYDKLYMQIWKFSLFVVCVSHEKRKKKHIILRGIITTVSTFRAHGFTTQLASWFARDGCFSFHSYRSKLSIVISRETASQCFDTRGSWQTRDNFQSSRDRCPIIVRLYWHGTCLQRSSVPFHTLRM